MANRPDTVLSTCGASGVPGVLERIRGEVRELTETLWAARETGELMDTVAGIEALKSTLDAVELQVVAELDATGAVKAVGWASTQDFLTHTTGGHKGTGPATVRLATAVTEPALAPVAEAMGDGWLSTTKAHVIERAVDRLPGDRALRARGVQVLLDDAKRLDATELKKVALHLVTVVDPDGDERRDEKALDRLERAAHLGRHLSITDDQAGGAWIKGRCSSEDAAHAQSHPDPARRTSAHRRPDLRPDVRWPRAVDMTAATHATTAPGCSTRSSRPADSCRPPRSCPSATEQCPA